MSYLLAKLDKYKNLIKTKFLTIDPSITSTTSKIGYAYFEECRLIKYSSIDLNPTKELSQRLYEIRNSLINLNLSPNLVIIEYIPPVVFSKQMNSKSVASLHKAIGAIMTVYNIPYIEISPLTVKKVVPENYKKSDINDAIVLGLFVLEYFYSLSKDEYKNIVNIITKDNK